MTTTSLSARVAQKVNSAARAQHKVAFLGLRPDIEEALKDGWPIISIWQTLVDEQLITFGYQTFRRYVHHFIRPEMVSPHSKGDTSLAPTTKIRGFIYNPHPNPKDLI